VTPVRPATSMATLLGPWLAEQRWYVAKGYDVAPPERLGGLRLVEDDGRVGVEVHLVAVRGADGVPVTYQVPLSYHTVEQPHLAHALVGRFDHPDLGVRWIYDGPHDLVFVQALLRLLDGGEATSARGAGGPLDEEDPPTARAVGVRQRVAPPPSGPAQVLRGEQSNTSIIVDRDGPDPMIVKLFRVLQPGTNPDVVVQSRLAAGGCERVPHPVGWIEGTWAAPDGVTVTGHLAYACEFVPDGEDAWRVACAAVERGEPFDDAARALGATTAQVHTALAVALPTRPVDAAVLARLADGLAARVGWAVSTAPVLGPFAAAALEAVDAVRGMSGLPDLPDLQQVHGDYHLGQVLHSPRRGWIVLDFEGEPLRPLAERLEPDLALRDVAGMLRSFDYAARHATIGLAPSDPAATAAAEWSRRARESFLAGYAEAGGRIGSPVLLRALELDKALYEVVYETLNRPAWVPIPLAALDRLATPV